MQTVVQILRCCILGSYELHVVDDHLEIEGPQPPDGPLPISMTARREELIDFLEDHCQGAWPPPRNAPIRSLGAALSEALDHIEDRGEEVA